MQKYYFSHTFREKKLGRVDSKNLEEKSKTWLYVHRFKILRNIGRWLLKDYNVIVFV